MEYAYTSPYAASGGSLGSPVALFLFFLDNEIMKWKNRIVCSPIRCDPIHAETLRTLDTYRLEIEEKESPCRAMYIVSIMLYYR